jgi:endonuclease YncB( thermonuclease family)
MTPVVRPISYVESAGDGDTPTLIVDVGLDSLRRVRVRLTIVDCPEAGQPGAAEARAFAAAWLDEHLPALTAAFHVTRTGRYVMSFNRHIADVYDAGTGESLSSALLRAGHAEVWEEELRKRKPQDTREAMAASGESAQ